MSEDLDDQPPPPNEVETALEDIIEKISVAGWKEALSERILWIRRCFQLTLIILSCCCLYYNYQNILKWAESTGISNEIADIPSNASLPFSNVTICAALYFNETFIRQNIRVPEKLIEAYTQKTNDTTDEFYHKLTLFLSPTSRPRQYFDVRLAFFWHVLHLNPQLGDFSEFATMAYLQCRDMLRRCWFNGQELDCCERALQSIDDDGICYMLALNMDNDNAVPVPSTYRQVRPGHLGGLTIEASIDLDEFPWLEDDIPDGFRILIDPTPYTLQASPVAAPHAAETFVKITPAMHSLAVNCAPFGHLASVTDAEALDFDPAVKQLAYDPTGTNCNGGNLQRIVHEQLNCYPPVYLNRPNSSAVCSPWAMYMLTTAFTVDFTDDMFKSLGGSTLAVAQIHQYRRNLENRLKKVVSLDGRCPSHCRYWSYESVSSFANLERYRKGDEKRMYARIHLYYAELGYRQYTEVKEQKIYLAFCDFGNVVGFYWGMSIVSFFHVFFYIIRYMYVKRRAKRKVGPEAEVPMRMTVRGRVVKVAWAEPVVQGQPTSAVVGEDEPCCSYA